MIGHNVNMPVPRRREGSGWTSTSEIPSPTVRPIETDMSCNAVWKPERYTSFEDEPDSCACTKLKRPPFARPEGSWKRMPVIYK